MPGFAPGFDLYCSKQAEQIAQKQLAVVVVRSGQSMPGPFQWHLT